MDLNLLYKFKKEHKLLHFLSLIFIAIILSYLLLQWGLLESLELGSIDLRFRWRKNLEPSPEIVLIKIDEPSLQAIPEPLIFWNPHLAKVIKALAGGGARVVAIDLIQRQSFHHLLPQHEQSLAQALLLVKDKTPVLLASEISPTQNHRGYKITEPIPAFRIFSEVGFINLTLDSDGVLRRQELVASTLATLQGKEANYYSSFPFMAAALYRGHEPRLEKGSLYLGQEFIPTDKYRRMYINFIGPGSPYPSFSFAQVLSKAQAGEGEYFRKNFGNKLVFLGAVTAEIEEKRMTPFSRQEGGIQPIAGVEVFAHTADTILSRRYIKAPGAGLTFLITLACAVIAVFISQRIKHWPGRLLVILLGVGYVGLVFYLFGKNYLLPVALPFQALQYAMILVNADQYALERRDRRILETTFKSYVNEEVMKQILKDPQLALTHGRRQRLTVLFSDLRQFTARTEKQEPEEVVDFLNEYLSAMTEVIITHGGTLDKFMGDGILCFFGAPLPLPQSGAPQALQAALGMQDKLLELNGKWGYTGENCVRMGVGIHTGEVIVGNIGSAKKMDYTVIGDTVNLASRLEGETKKVPYAILVSEEAFIEAGRPAQACYVEEIPVRGREGKVKVYGLGSPKE